MCRARASFPIPNNLHTADESFIPAFSFSPVVLMLKVIMSQQGLDKPFTGGLGSYKLYVLVAYHVSME